MDSLNEQWLESAKPPPRSVAVARDGSREGRFCCAYSSVGHRYLFFNSILFHTTNLEQCFALTTVIFCALI